MDSFDAKREPMRAIRDLISAVELSGDFQPGENVFLDRARDGFTALRKLFGDERPGEEIAAAAMIEPKIASVPAVVKTLQQAAGALHRYERQSLVDPTTPIKFVGNWAHLGTMFISDIVDRANEALEGAVP